jgi:hypothetical protein
MFDILGYIISIINLLSIIFSSWKIKKSNFEKQYWAIPIILGSILVISNAYYFSNIKEKDTKKKEKAKEIYFHISMVPIYITVITFLIYIFKDSPIPFFFLLR